MLNQLNDIEEVFESALLDNTTAHENVFMNRLDPLNIADQEGKYIFGYFMSEQVEDHDSHSSEYHNNVKYVFECLVSSKDIDVLVQVRNLASQVQKILGSIEQGAPLYFDLFYSKTTLVTDEGRSVPLAGYKLEYNLSYLASTHT